jgi:DNA end-binding protein Ku
MHPMFYLDKIKPMDEIEGVSNSQQPKVDNKESSLGKTLVENLSNKEFDVSQYSDAYTKELEKLIIAKTNGEKINVKAKEKEQETSKEPLEALKASLQKSKTKMS